MLRGSRVCVLQGLPDHRALHSFPTRRSSDILSRAEIAQLIDHGTKLSDPAMLKHAFMLEARYEERLPDDKVPSLTTRAARAIGRETLSEIALQQAIGKLDSFVAHKQFTAVPVKDL